MDFILLDEGFNSFSTEFTSNKIINLIDEHLTSINSPHAKHKITEETYDELYDEIVPNDTISKLWHIEYFYLSENVPNHDEWRIVPKYIIRVSFLEGVKGKSNFVELLNRSNVRGDYMCEDKICSIKFMITKKEKALKIRYLEREQLLLFINGSITNYQHFSEEEINQINTEKKESKKRRILEDPFILREIVEYIDYVPSIMTNKILGRCF